MQLFQFLIGEKESLEKMESFPVCPATPSNKAGICSPQVTFIYGLYTQLFIYTLLKWLTCSETYLTPISWMGILLSNNLKKKAKYKQLTGIIGTK